MNSGFPDFQKREKEAEIVEFVIKMIMRNAGKRGLMPVTQSVLSSSAARGHIDLGVD
jgi:hypothetical protein